MFGAQQWKQPTLKTSRTATRLDDLPRTCDRRTTEPLSGESLCRKPICHLSARYMGLRPTLFGSVEGAERIRAATGLLWVGYGSAMGPYGRENFVARVRAGLW